LEWDFISLEWDLISLEWDFISLECDFISLEWDFLSRWYSSSSLCNSVALCVTPCNITQRTTEKAQRTQRASRDK
jgi:hypothetical protein